MFRSLSVLPQFIVRKEHFASPVTRASNSEILLQPLICLRVKVSSLFCNCDQIRYLSTFVSKNQKHKSLCKPVRLSSAFPCGQTDRRMDMNRLSVNLTTAFANAPQCRLSPRCLRLLCPRQRSLLFASFVYDFWLSKCTWNL